jgi:tocopherol O-methyltransferase
MEIRGEHIHHGYFLTPSDTKEKAQVQLIDLLLERSALPAGSTVLDVGCGIGGTSRFLAKSHGCNVTGVTISGRQVEIARKLTLEASAGQSEVVDATTGAAKLGDGSVRFIELDAEKMGEYFNEAPNTATFDCVWISEAMSHLPNKELFFRNAALLLNPGGKLVVADWFKSEELTEDQFKADISPIEGPAPIFSRPSLN